MVERSVPLNEIPPDDIGIDEEQKILSRREVLGYAFLGLSALMSSGGLVDMFRRRGNIDKLIEQKDHPEKVLFKSKKDVENELKQEQTVISVEAFTATCGSLLVGGVGYFLLEIKNKED